MEQLQIKHERTMPYKKQGRVAKKPTLDELHDLYILQGLSARAIAEQLGVSRSTVNRWVKLAREGNYEK